MSTHDAARARREAAQAEAALRAGEPNAHELLIWRADAAHEAALCAGCVPDTVRRFVVRCGARKTRTGDAVLWDNGTSASVGAINTDRSLNIPTIGGGPHV